ncbi:hypothetical protein [Acidovorax kalamii]|uniref:hypothetical protein n=1 Tax=Acidovorax kalamii TaxID=2004485 RepID=UPI0020908FE0|nr:hypothetical protein [Acidovorax kalamii]MCO5358072.1 hypothetical protein [Acidovorax kalamii]
MRLKNEMFNRALISSHLFAYAAVVVFFMPHQKNFTVALSLFPVLLLFFLWKIKKPIIFLVVNIFILGVFLLIEMFDFGGCFEYFFDELIFGFDYYQSGIFLKTYLLVFSFLIFYFPIALFVSLVNLGISSGKKIMTFFSATAALLFLVFQLIFSCVYIGWKSGAVVLVTFQLLTVVTFFYGGVSKKGREYLGLFGVCLNRVATTHPIK